MSGLLSRLRDELKDPEFRHNYVAENTRRGLAYQIKALREARGWSQAEFARQAGKPQSNIHRWEDPTYGKFSLSTLIEVASTFDVALVVKFVGFGALLDSVADLRPKKLAVPTYEEEVANIDAVSTRQTMSKFGALAAFSVPLEQSANQRSALSEAPNGTIKLPPLPHDTSQNQSTALIAGVR
jgi:transcriptional regulator with XRE-family HTH domain